MEITRQDGRTAEAGGAGELETLRARLAEYERLEGERARTADASRMLGEAASLFLGQNSFDPAVRTVLEVLGNCLSAGRVRVMELIEEGKYLRNTHEWIMGGTPAAKDRLQFADGGSYEPLLAPLRAGQTVAASSVETFPEPLRGHLRGQGIGSLLAFPVQAGGILHGYLEANAASGGRNWSRGDVSILRQGAELLGRAVERRRGDQALRDTFREVERIQRQHDAVMRSTPHGLCLLTSNWRVIWANDAAKRILRGEGGTEAGLTGDWFERCFRSRQVFEEYARAATIQVRRTGTDKRETELLRADGSLFWCEISVVRHDPSSTASGFVATLTDVTERRRAEQATLDSERRFRSLVQNSMDMLQVYDAKGRMTYLNPAVERVLGHKIEAMLGRSGMEFVHPDDAALAEETFLRVMEKAGEGVQCEFRTRCADGSYRLIEGIVTNLLDDPSVKGIVANSRDATDSRRAVERLRESETLYESLVEGLTQNVFRKDAAGRFTYVNAKFCKTTGKTKEQLLGKTDFDVFPRPLAQKYRDDDMKVMESGRTWETVEENRDPIGRKIYVQVVKTPVFDASKRLAGLQGIFWDITERIEAEKAVRRSEERYRDFVDNLPIGVYRIEAGPEGRIAAANPAMARMFGYDSVEDFMEVSAAGLHADEDERRAFIGALLSEGKAVNFEMKLRRRDGSIFWVNNSTSVQRGPGGEVQFYDGVLRDITERKRAEEARRVSEEKYRSLLDNSADGFYEVDLAGNMTYANPALSRLTGYSREELLGLNNRVFMDSENAKRVFDNFHQVYLTGEPHHGFVYDLRRKDGGVVTVEGSISLVRAADGSPAGFQGVTRDVTERIRAERGLAEKTLLLERANQDLVRKNAELDEFTYIASHDLQEPLRKLVAFSEFLKKDLGDDLPDRARKDLGFIIDAASRMQTLIQDLLQLSRAGKAAMKRERLPLGTAVDRALEALALRLETTGARVYRDEHLPVVWGDPTMLTQLFQNLLGNALKFVSPDRAPELRVTVEPGTNGVPVIGVRDNGIGIKPEYQEQIFAPFKRLHGRDKYEGTGIGLSICRKCVERHGGRIWVESAPGEGAHFKFTLGERKEDRDEKDQ